MASQGSCSCRHPSCSPNQSPSLLDPPESYCPYHPSTIGPHVLYCSWETHPLLLVPWRIRLQPYPRPITHRHPQSQTNPDVLAWMALVDLWETWLSLQSYLCSCCCRPHPLQCRRPSRSNQGQHSCCF